MRAIRMVGERLNVPSEELQKFGELSRERKMRRKLERLLEKMPTEEREHSTISVNVDESRLEEAKERIKAFRKELTQFLDAGVQEGKTYQISVSMFPLSGL